MVSAGDLRTDPAPVSAAAHLAHLHAQCFAVLPETPWSADAFRTILRVPTTAALIARFADDDIAGLLVGRQVAGEGEILTLCVTPSMRRGGVARALLAGFFARLPRDARVTLEVAVDNRPAIALYESAGFIASGRRPDYYRGGKNPVDAIIYARNPAT